MRKFSKVALIFAAVVGVAGTAMTIGGAAMGATIAGLNIGKYGLGKTVNKVMLSTESDKNWDMDWDEINAVEPEWDGSTEVYLISRVSSLDISLSADQLTLEEYDGDSLRVEVSGNEKNQVRVGEDEDTLVIETIGRKNDRHIQIQYPKGTKFEDTSIDVAAGTVEMQSDFQTEDLDIEVAAGEVTNSGQIIAESADISVGTGNMELQNLKVTDLEGDCGVGNISLGIVGSEKDYNYEISCGAGCVQIGDNSYEGLGHDESVSNAGATGDMDLNCGIGNFEISFSKES